MLTLCRSCGSPDLRTSHFRLKDLPFLLILHYPMRCWVCQERDYVFIPRIFQGQSRRGTPRWWRVQARLSTDLVRVGPDQKYSIF
jgi:hypothetical protein